MRPSDGDLDLGVDAQQVIEWAITTFGPHINGDALAIEMVAQAMLWLWTVGRHGVDDWPGAPEPTQEERDLRPGS